MIYTQIDRREALGKVNDLHAERGESGVFGYRNSVSSFDREGLSA